MSEDTLPDDTMVDIRNGELHLTLNGHGVIVRLHGHYGVFSDGPVSVRKLRAMLQPSIWNLLHRDRKAEAAK